MFFGSFWHAFGYMNNSSNLENTLKQENLTPEILLDTDNIVNDIKQSQAKFITFLKKNSHFTQAIINYAIQMPDAEGTDEKKLYKYPFVSSEILGAQMKGLEEVFFDVNPEESQKSEDDEEEEQEEVEEEEHDEAQTRNETDEKSNEKPKEESSDSSESTNKQETSTNESASAAPEEQSTPESSQQAATAEEEASPNKSDKSPKSKTKKYSGKDLLDLLLTFINSEEPLNDTSAGYFLKALNNVLTQSGQFLNYLEDKPQVLKQLVHHIRTKSISEVVLKLLTMVTNDSPQDLFVEQRKTLINLLQEKFLTGESFERENIAHIIHEVVQAFIQGDNPYRQTKCSPSVQVMILEDSFIETFFKVIVNKDSSSSSIGYAANVLSVLVTYYNSKIRSRSNRNSQGHNSDEDDVVCNGAADEEKIAFPGEKSFLEHIPQLLSLIQSASSAPRHTTSYGAEIAPFGVGKLKVVELIAHVFKSEQSSIIANLANNSIYPTLLDLMVTNPWNNLLHVQIDKIIMESINIVINGSNEAVTQNLFGESFNLLEFIANKSQQETSRPGSISKNIRQGHIGYLTNFARKLNETSSCTTLTQLKENSEVWNSYIANLFETITTREKQVLGGDNPKNKKDEDEDPARFEIDIQKIYEKFNTYFRNGKTSKDDTLQDSKDDFDQNEDNTEEILEEEGIESNEANNQEEKELDQDVEHQQQATSEAQENTSAPVAVQQDQETAEKLLQEEEKLLDYTAHNYWKLDSKHNIDKLMEEL